MAYTTINKSTDYFNTKLYTGDGNNARAITGVGFQPDFTWLKTRNDTQSHQLFDAVRGATKNLHSNTNGAEATYSDALQSFNSDGFTIGTSGGINGSGDTVAAWNWKANGAGSSNTDGTITSSVSANTTAGFSIVSYTGTGANATVGHGLGSVPRMIIVKRRDGSDDWLVQHGSLGSGKALNLNSTGTVQTYDPYWNATEPTTSVFSIGNDGRTNGSSETYIAYCFAEKKGYSKIGSYTSNNNANGTFVYTGFKPSFIILKNTSSGGTAWHLYDNKRLGYNVDNNYLFPNSDTSEATADQIDILSNGFKLRYVGDNNNGSDNIIYMAFGQSLVGSNNVPCTAR